MWLKSGVAVAVACKLAATALIQPLAWELPYAADAALKMQKRKEKKKEKKSFFFKTVLALTHLKLHCFRVGKCPLGSSGPF